VERSCFCSETKIRGLRFARIRLVGCRQGYEDVDFDWARREIMESGCVFVRLDRIGLWHGGVMR